MEEPKSEQPMQPTPQTPNPNTAQNFPPPPPQPPSSLPPNPRKRPIDNNAAIQNSQYFKMRAVLKDIRPHFIEVLRTPDFQNCNAANEIREKLKLLMDLYKDVTADTVAIGKCKNVPAEQQEGVNAADQPPLILLGRTSEKQQPEGMRILGTYTIGGSAFGWNFITFPGNKAVYYGRTKESFRSANPISP